MPADCYLRTSEVQKCAAGISQVMGGLIKLFVGGWPEFPTNLAKGGMTLKMENDTLRMLFAIVAMILQDGGAHKHFWCCKGDSGSKLCMLCRNLVLQNMGRG